MEKVLSYTSHPVLKLNRTDSSCASTPCKVLKLRKVDSHYHRVEIQGFVWPHAICTSVLPNHEPRVLPFLLQVLEKNQWFLIPGKASFPIAVENEDAIVPLIRGNLLPIENGFEDLIGFVT